MNREERFNRIKSLDDFKFIRYRLGEIFSFQIICFLVWLVIFLGMLTYISKLSLFFKAWLLASCFLTLEFLCLVLEIYFINKSDNVREQFLLKHGENKKNN